MNKDDKIDTRVRYSPLKIPSIIWGHWKAKGKPSANFKSQPSSVKSELTKQTAEHIAESVQREFADWINMSDEQKMDVHTNPSKYFVFGDLRASETNVDDLRLPEMNSGKTYITFKYNILFETLSHPDSMGVLFFDEMNLARNDVKSQFYKVINDRAIGDIPISKNVLCVSAGNESEHSRAVTMDPVPLVLRRGNYFLRPLTTEEFLDYATMAGIHKWIIGYLAFQPGDGHKLVFDSAEGDGQPCPRTWSRLSQILSADKDMSIEDVEMFATGWVGQGVAKKFAAYVKSAKDLDLKKILDHPETIVEFEREAELSLMYAVVSGMIDIYRENKKELPKVLAVVSHMERVELGAFFLRGIKYADEKNFGKNMATIDPALMDKVVQRYKRFIN